ILAGPGSTHQYRKYAKQKLNLYNSTNSPAKAPILIFLHGRGSTCCGNILPMFPEGLVYHNMGTFFAQRGLNTIVADYRRVNDPEAGTG
ncbi:hypothetical protein BJ878DRAFT_431303, partial [Calycina marina]